MPYIYMRGGRGHSTALAILNEREKRGRREGETKGEKTATADTVRDTARPATKDTC